MAADAGGSESTNASLDGHGIFAIVVFAVVALICIQPLKIPLPRVVGSWAQKCVVKLCGRGISEDDDVGFYRRPCIVLNHVWTPAIGILFLLATKTIGGEQVRTGIVGEEGVEPYDVLALFISLAYIAISLDATGLLRYLAFQVCLKAGTSGMRLYLVLYLFFWFAGVLVGNDPVILSGTAFVVYLTRVAGISPPSAWIWAQFVAANISSAVLVSSNPTNLVIATGFSISFPTYTAYMMLPSMASALAGLLVLLLFFRDRPAASQAKTKERGPFAQRWSRATSWARSRASSSVSALRLRHSSNTPGTSSTPAAAEEHEMSTTAPVASTETKEGKVAPTVYIPRTMIRPDVDARAALVDRNGAIFGSVIMAATLITLIVTSVFGGVKVYMIAVPGAVVCLIRDVGMDWWTWRSHRKAERRSGSRERRGDEVQRGQQGADDPTLQRQGSNIDNAAEAKEPRSEEVHRTMLGRTIDKAAGLADVFPTVTYVATRLPFPLLPFAFGMFILVQSLAHVGFIEIMAKGIGNVCARGQAACAFFIATLGVVLCNVSHFQSPVASKALLTCFQTRSQLGGTNIGATIILTKVIQSPAFKAALPPDAEGMLLTKTAFYSVAFGSNVGALGGTFAASLAGLLWRDGLRQRGVVVTATQFALWCGLVIVPCTAAGVAVLLAEVRYFNGLD